MKNNKNEKQNEITEATEYVVIDVDKANDFYSLAKGINHELGVFKFPIPPRKGELIDPAWFNDYNEDGFGYEVIQVLHHARVDKFVPPYVMLFVKRKMLLEIEDALSWLN